LNAIFNSIKIKQEAKEMAQTGGQKAHRSEIYGTLGRKLEDSYISVMCYEITGERFS